MESNNFDQKTIDDFGDEWNLFQQNKLSGKELFNIYKNYFSIFPWNQINKSSIGADIGCGTGRWAYYVAPKIKTLYCVDPSSKALNIAKSNLNSNDNCVFLKEHVGNLSLQNDSLDFAYSLGVLHHIPDTFKALKECVKKLKKGAPFLVYLYYNFENKSFFLKFIWKLSNILIKIISSIPFKIKKLITDFLALIIYLPLARLSLLFSKLNINPSFIPLSFYKDKSFYTMRTDSLDRFGTKIEQRFSKNEIHEMMTASNLTRIIFLEREPFWVAVGFKK
jgi:ubiquinone/menaquinone biosynthesis C-methylase UbiE